MAQKRYQVFISSTYSDLRPEREALTWALLKANHIPAGMENFPATDDRGWRVIKRTIDESDYYVLVLAGRYGSIDPSTGLSYTEMEYDYARSKGIPVLAFVREKSAIRGDHVDQETERVKKLSDFVAKVDASHLRKVWTSSESLSTEVVTALAAHIRDDAEVEARPGWYRGNDLPSSSRSVAEDVAQIEADARLKEANAQRVHELELAKLQMASPPQSRCVAAFVQADPLQLASLVVRNEGSATATDLFVVVQREPSQATWTSQTNKKWREPNAGFYSAFSDLRVPRGVHVSVLDNIALDHFRHAATLPPELRAGFTITLRAGSANGPETETRYHFPAHLVSTVAAYSQQAPSGVKVGPGQVWQQLLAGAERT